MFVQEEIRRTIHAWRGAMMPTHFAVSLQDVETLAREADHALQETAKKTAEDITRLA